MGELPGTFTFHRVNICSFSIYNPITLSRWAGDFKGDNLFFLIKALMLVVCQSKFYLPSKPPYAVGKARKKIYDQIAQSHGFSLFLTKPINFCSSLLCDNLKRKCLSYPLFCKSPLEITTIFSTALAQLCVVLLWENRWERETAALSYVSHLTLLPSGLTEGLSPENWG